MPTLVREHLAKAERSAVHLETRDAYMLTDPGFIAWQDGRRLDPKDRASWWGGWHDAVADAAGKGVRLRRARIVSEPVTDYIRYEYDVTFTNLAAGEEVRWLPRRRASLIALPGNDFWLFDEQVVVFNHFAGDGRSGGMELCGDPAAARLCTDAFEAVWNRAVPHADYRPA
ncbi:hypothetical protein BIV57_10860 [Mangrovactinospora gilvigrisea]|uniref:DUF6879 domain-containing protein n=1 Tax=Mangrovactinospora gilvigrisea TaxID=1428644 RepID=A0A1J7BFW0_9ACTN|nr:DUF6879 family protein [Mangrovactinospora gilvigrisea]OIV37461.1 hypothetical protein BIV57_10860 [Mangrovactinospora gilvigrisea]